ncbi:MAG: condensation domain-containing protein [Maribacter sp.]
MTQHNSKKDIESIHPLNQVQQGLLFHSLSSKKDQGFLNVQCDILGTIELSKFEEAWGFMVARHAVLRTSVHWKNLEKPVQVVHKQKSINFILLDWSNEKDSNQNNKWAKLIKENITKGVSFSKGALLDVKLIKLGDAQFRLLWTNHHLLLDGWSSNIILKELFRCYEALVQNYEVNFEKLPAYKAYLRWLGQKKEEPAKAFWSSYFKEFKSNGSFDVHNRIEQSDYLKLNKEFNVSETNTLKQYASENRLSLNTILQGIWSITLCRFFNITDSVHGTTVSGRSVDFPNMENITGMFSKVHPVRNILGASKKPLSKWFAENQKRQLETSTFEYLDIDDITKHIRNKVKKPLFDSLLIFENYPVASSDEASITISNFKSGITSTYPVSVVLVPGDSLKLKLFVSKYISEYEKVGEWLIHNFLEILSCVIYKKITDFSEIKTQIPTFQNKETSSIAFEKEENEHITTKPKTETEGIIAQIWQDVFNLDDIGIHENFFKLGGKSLLAVKLFSILNEKMGTKLYPTTLLEHPTVASLANLFEKDDKKSTYTYLVPIKTKGDKTPVFCIHGGGAQVYFFNPLANALPNDRPVYALQPSGDFEEDNLHKSIAEMAKDYTEEIRKVQPNGPYNLLVYCFSTAVGIEIASILKADDQEVKMIIVDSLIDQEDFSSPDRIKLRFLGFLSRVVENPLKALKLGYRNHLPAFIKRKRIRYFGNEGEKKLEATKQNLIDIYNAYEWKQKFPGAISLLLTEKPDSKINKMYIDNWQKMSDEKIKAIPVEAEHHELFIEPKVIVVGKLVERELY